MRNIKNQLLLLIITVFSFNSYAQIEFEKGYYINNSGEKINCQIKNIDWKNNPTQFEYRLSENNEPQKETIKSVKEFGIQSASKYIRSTVNIDRSSNNINDLSIDKNPIFNEEELFLKVLIEGKSCLYEYVEGNLIRYFFKDENAAIEQLVYKKYLIKGISNNIGVNNRFRQQLFVSLKCPSFEMKKMEGLSYRKNDLVRLFKEYNKCQNNDFVDFEKKGKRDAIHLTIRPRLNSSSLQIESFGINSFRGDDFGNKASLGIGLEAEYIFPFNKNKWSVLLEPTYQHFKMEKTTDEQDVAGGTLTRKLHYKSIEIPVSVRHYLYLSKNSTIFVNASLVLDFNSKSSIEFIRNEGSELSPLEITSGSNLAFGIGYKQNDKYSIEMRGQTKRSILNYPNYSSAYQTFSVILGYSLF